MQKCTSSMEEHGEITCVLHVLCTSSLRFIAEHCMTLHDTTNSLQDLPRCLLSAASPRYPFCARLLYRRCYRCLKPAAAVTVGRSVGHKSAWKNIVQLQLGPPGRYRGRQDSALRFRVGRAPAGTLMQLLFATLLFRDLKPKLLLAGLSVTT